MRADEPTAHATDTVVAVQWVVRAKSPVSNDALVMNGLGLQATHRVRGELTTGRKLPPTLQTPECRPGQSRARADLTASEEARW